MDIVRAARVILDLDIGYTNVKHVVRIVESYGVDRVKKMEEEVEEEIVRVRIIDLEERCYAAHGKGKRTYL